MGAKQIETVCVWRKQPRGNDDASCFPTSHRIDEKKKEQKETITTTHGTTQRTQHDQDKHPTASLHHGKSNKDMSKHVLTPPCFGII
jgi:hypothetical protein